MTEETAAAAMPPDAEAEEEEATDSESPKKKKKFPHNWFTYSSNGSKMCNRCDQVFAPSTTAGSLKYHLKNIHGVTDPDVLAMVTPLKTPKANDIRTMFGKQRQSELEDAVVDYIIGCSLSHAHVEDACFKQFINILVPGFMLMTRKTLKKRLLEQYVVTKSNICDYLAVTNTKVSITFDGWSNWSMTGFYAVTLHFVDPSTATLSSLVLDMFYVTPGTDVSKRVAAYIFKMLNSFGIWTRLVAVVSDNASDATAAARLLTEYPGAMLTKGGCCRCIVHTMDLGVKASFTKFQAIIDTLRSNISSMRYSKNKRATFRRFANGFLGKEREPPRLDCVTRWYSTFVMIKKSLELQDVINSTVKDPSWGDRQAREAATLTPEDWANAQELHDFLEVPALISTQMGGQGNVTISMATLALQNLTKHCDGFMHHENETIQECATIIKDYCDDYASLLSSEVALVAQFLDPRFPVPRCPKGRALVEELLAATYPNESNGMVQEKPRHADLFESVFGAEQDTECDEVSVFAAMRAAPKDCDILKWWITRQETFPRLFLLAMDYLAIPASSVPAERANSKAKRTFDGRASLHNDTFKAEMCLRSWKQLLSSKSKEPPLNMKAAFEKIDSATLDAMGESDTVVSYLIQINSKPAHAKGQGQAGDDVGQGDDSDSSDE
jgi:hAT family C-terminal dimerisation region